jgi:hypothetical protein
LPGWIGTPSTVIEPLVTGVRPRIILPIVLFPLPLSPMRETTSPGRTSKLTVSTAVMVRPPKVPTL